MGGIRAGVNCNTAFVILVLSCRVHAASSEYDDRQRTLTVLRLRSFCASFLASDMKSLTGVSGCNFNRVRPVG